MSLVCDRINDCPEWEKYMAVDSNLSTETTFLTMRTIMIMQNWKYCPWCGKEIYSEKRMTATEVIKRRGYE